MSILTRLILICGAIGVLLYFFYKIRKKRVHIHYAIYWTFFAVTTLILCIFPEVMVFVSNVVGVQVPVHAILTVFIGLMILKLFEDTLKLSDLEKKIESLTQEIALLNAEKSDRKGANNKR